MINLDDLAVLTAEINYQTSVGYQVVSTPGVAGYLADHLAGKGQGNSSVTGRDYILYNLSVLYYTLYGQAVLQNSHSPPAGDRDVLHAADDNMIARLKQTL